ncbi:MAG: hypothetical protein KatS3mg008_1287 [Acidimicrobiales bacterium]|nr:MAG: hypothetical protein KatS3mg008_1287 [Acidimicrobiales bacterium]
MAEVAEASSTKRRALVLGGGGPVGVGWEAGLGAGIAEAGVNLAEADCVIGTSAGSITGAYLCKGDDPVELASKVGEMFRSNVDGTGVDRIPETAIMTLMQTMMELASRVGEGGAEEVFRELGRSALEAETIPEEAYVTALERAFGGWEWPAAFRCTAVNAETGEFRVWDQSSGVPVSLAVASSCAVPMIYPPVTIDGGRWMDGGVRSPLNADLAAGYDVVVVVSVMPLQLPPGLGDERLIRFFDMQREQVDGLRAEGAAVEVIVPDMDFLSLSGLGMRLMDFGLVEQAAELGRRLGREVADRIGAVWG